MSFSKGRRKLVFAIVLLLISVVMLSISILNPAQETHLFRKVALESIAPLEGVVNKASAQIAGVWERYIFLVNLGEKNRELVTENHALSKKINDYREIYLEYLRLKELVGLKEKTDYPTVAARVVGRKQSPIFETILIDKGSADGIRVGQPVLAVEGILGKVMEASWHVSKVLLLVDYNSNIDTLIQRGRAHGILQGAGEKGCKLKYVRRTEDVKIGDVVVTSGLAGVFPKGLVLGTVYSVEKKETGLFQEIQISPAVDVTRLEDVLVVLKDKGGQG